MASPKGLAILKISKGQVPWDLPFSKGLESGLKGKVIGRASPMGLAIFEF